MAHPEIPLDPINKQAAILLSSAIPLRSDEPIHLYDTEVLKSLESTAKAVRNAKEAHRMVEAMQVKKAKRAVRVADFQDSLRKSEIAAAGLTSVENADLLRSLKEVLRDEFGTDRLVDFINLANKRTEERNKIAAI